VSRGTSNGSKNTVRLSAAEREAASDMGMSEKEYAAQKVALIKEGKLK
jgi:phage I-like protein